jgi:hypothetical protein
MALPTFVIGGARKAGTTALWAFLSSHPQIWMSPLKEPHFLTRDPNNPAPGVRIIGATRTPTHDRGLTWYESLFEDGAACPARGEASTSYLGALDGPKLMDRLVPGLKVIFVLRHPVDRAYSDYWQSRKRGHRVPPFASILDDEPSLRHLFYMGRYREHIARYREALGPERVHLVLFDDLRSDPAGTYRSICRYVGVDDDFQPDFSVEHNPHEEPVNPSLNRLLARTTYRRWTFLPGRVRRPARRIRDFLRTRNLRPATYPAIDADVHDRLLDKYSEDVAYVESLTRPLPAWRRRRTELESDAAQPSPERP